ncbi:hypothetical protein NMY22_g10819 [Coprinellus aureogranulatus]|nr:hypothetical protein NMY22_g10819 [Coprinellus aureogranulatus]
MPSYASFVQEANVNNVGGNFFDQRQFHSMKFGLSWDPLERESIYATIHPLSLTQGAIVGLEKHISKGAAHDSAERGSDAPKCDPETRVAVQQDILSWIRYGHQDPNPTNILWLSGPAGAGKTAIMRSVSDTCHYDGTLAASFFFSAHPPSSPDRRWKRYLVPTLAYHLIHRKTIPGLKDKVLEAIIDNPLVFDKTLEQQMDILILQPLAALGVSKVQEGPHEVVIADGLDECDADLDMTFSTKQEHRRSRENNQEEILSVLARASRSSHFPFRIVIASRPEHVIQDFFSTHPGTATQVFLTDKYDPDSDIARYLEAKFNNIRRKFSLPKSWASEKDIRKLVENASGQFIYASTAIRYIEDNTEPPPPHDRLQRVLETSPKGSRPLEPLDALYTSILKTSPDPPLTALWLRAIDRCHYIHEFLKGLLESYPGETETLLKGLGSLVGLHNEQARIGEPPSFRFIFYHKSLIDFLKDKVRSEDLYWSDDSTRQFIKDCFYRVLKGALYSTLRHMNSEYVADKGSRSAITDKEFIVAACSLLEDHVDPCRLYVGEDVAWWMAGAVMMDRGQRIQAMFSKVHDKVRLGNRHSSDNKD